MLKWVDYLPQETMFWRRTLWDRSVDALTRAFASQWTGTSFSDSRTRAPDSLGFLGFSGRFACTLSRRLPPELSGTGATEMDRLRRRIHGRRVSRFETYMRARGYLIRHRVCHMAW